MSHAVRAACSLVNRSRAIPTISRRAPQHRTPFSPITITRCAASGSDIKLDKNTPDEKWKELLSAEEFYVLRMKGTEPPRTGKYDKFFEEGDYVCAACGAPLYSSESKFNSGCGWPAFYEEIPDTVERHEDTSMGMKRVEITCKNCGGHLGHVFEGEGFPTPTDQRHCVNSISIKFRPKKE